MMDLLRRLAPRPVEEKAATDLRPRRRVVGEFMPEVKWTPRNYQAFIDEGYKSAVWVYACVNEISTAARALTPILYRRTPGGPEEVGPREAGYDLIRLLEEPNRVTAWPDLMESLVAYTLLSGNRYVVGLNAGGETVAGRGTKPRRLYTLSPQSTRVADGGNRFEYALLHGPKDNPQRFEPGEFVHGRTFNPSSDFYGLGVIEAAWRGVDLWNASMAHNTALLQNGARPSGAWVTEEALTDQQFARTKDQMREYEGASNAGKQLLLEGGLDWKAFALTPKDLDWISGLSEAAHQIHGAFKVHPVLTGFETASFENQDQALRQLYVRAVLPAAEAILSDLTRWLGPRFGDGLYLGIDRDKIEALSEDRDALWTRTREAFDSGILTREEAREALGYDPEAEGTFAAARGAPLALSSGGPSERRAASWSKPARDAYWKAYDQRLGRNDEKIAARARSLFRGELDRILDTLTGTEDPTAVNYADLIDEEAWREGLEEVMLATAVDAGRSVRGDIKSQLPEEAKALQPTEFRQFEQVFGLLGEGVLDFVRAQAATAVVNVSKTTMIKIRRQIDLGIEAGEDVFAIRDRIETLYLDQIIPNRSEVIARTESIKAYNFGGQQAAIASGVKLSKVWLATRDSRVRDAHAMADDQRVALEDWFDVDGELLEYPGDPAGSAANIIQCRCGVAYEVEE